MIENKLKFQSIFLQSISNKQVVFKKITFFENILPITPRTNHNLVITTLPVKKSSSVEITLRYRIFIKG